MPIDAATLHDRFQKLGKIIHLGNLAAPQALAYKRASVGLIDQIADATDPSVEFDVVDTVAGPLNAITKRALASLAAVPVAAKSAAETYLRRFFAVDLGLAAGATLAQINTTLTARMTSLAETCHQGGAFATFLGTLGIAVPTSADAATIDDAWVTDTVI